MKQRITHPRKALWIYHCELCNHTRTSVDQFRAIEAQQLHERGQAHFRATFEAALNANIKPIAEAFKQIGVAAETAISIVAKAFTLTETQNNYTLAPPPWAGNIAKQHRPKGNR